MIDLDTPWDEDDEAQRFVERHPEGATFAEIAKAAGVSSQLVWTIEVEALARLAGVPRAAVIAEVEAAGRRKRRKVRQVGLTAAVRCAMQEVRSGTAAEIAAVAGREFVRVHAALAQLVKQGEVRRYRRAKRVGGRKGAQCVFTWKGVAS